MKIARVTLDGLEAGLITDEPPRIAFALTSEREADALRSARITMGDWSVDTDVQTGVLYGGELAPRTEYTVHVRAESVHGEVAEATTTFRTGRRDVPWTARWITDGRYRTPKKQSPTPMVFARSIPLRGPLRRAWIECTALGVYELDVNGHKVGTDYFAPGFTSYHHQIQYQTYDITELLGDQNELRATVAGGWAVGSFTYHRKNKLYADRQAFLAEVHLEYADGSRETVCTDERWGVSTDGPYRMAEWYDGETFDARIRSDSENWPRASITKPKGRPQLIASYGAPVRAQRELTPVVSHTAPSGEVIYDFGQNFAGVIRAKLRGRDGQTVVFRHAEVLVDGELFTTSLRTAKATASYTCVDGPQEYSPRLTYMGFRYVGVRGVDPADLELSAYVLHSDVPETGGFACSDDRLNALQSAIQWGGRSNLVDIPTDCPQRDEREGWTGDYAVFARTASFNFDVSRFVRKWMRDMRAEQARGGGIPMVVPRAGNPFPVMATSVWGDVCVLAPWAEYLARGDVGVLRNNYAMMARFVRAAVWWAGLFSLRRHRKLIWRFPFQFGDWAAPSGGAREWIALGRWIATPYLANTAGIMAEIADILGEEDDAQHYRALRTRVVEAYRAELTDGNGIITKEFQTAYVLPLHFGMTAGAETETMVERLSNLIQEAGGHLATGFPGTPYILFALSDNGRLGEAYELLLTSGVPSWLYMIDSGGTTIWERWDALRPDGTVNIADLSSGSDDSGGGMVSFNHYAAGAVGDWLYRRIAGIEPTSGGYRTFRVEPRLGGGLTWASAHVDTPYGRASSAWRLEGARFVLEVEVPVSAEATIVTPDGDRRVVGSGRHAFECEVNVLARITSSG